MPFIGTWALSSTLTAYLQVTSPNTASAIDADTLPSYRVYCSTGNTPLTSGAFAQLDATNTDGFYAAQFVLSTTHGFSASGTYCIRKIELVCGVSTATLDIFRIFLSA
jgi:hypothetical protein